MVHPSQALICSLLLALLLVGPAYGLDPRPEIITTNLDAYQSTTYELSCEIHNVDSTVTTPTWEFRCTTCDSFRPISSGLIPDDQQNYGLKIPGNDIYILQVKNVNFNHTGSYRCAVQYSTYVKITDTVDVRVVQAPAIDPMLTSLDQSVALGESMRLQCSALGSPKPAIKWERAGRGMFPNGGFVVVGEILDFGAVDISHDGPYICTAQNDVGTITRVINLRVRSPPVVTITTRSPSQMPGYQLKLLCEVRGSPAVSAVQWYRTVGGRRELLPGDSGRFTLSSFDAAAGKKVSKLVITGGVIEEDYSATFECTGTNQLGSDGVTTRVTRSSEPMRLGCYPVQGASQLAVSLALTLACLAAALTGLV